MWWRISSWCRRLIHHSRPQISTAFLIGHIWIESTDLYHFLSGYGSTLKNSPQAAIARGLRPSNIATQKERLGLWCMYSSKSLSGDLRHNCAPQLCWRFLPPEQDQQSRKSACTFAAAHSLGSQLQRLKQRHVFPSDFAVVGKPPV